MNFLAESSPAHEGNPQRKVEWFVHRLGRDHKQNALEAKGSEKASSEYNGNGMSASGISVNI